MSVRMLYGCGAMHGRAVALLCGASSRPSCWRAHAPLSVPRTWLHTVASPPPPPNSTEAPSTSSASSSPPTSTVNHWTAALPDIPYGFPVSSRRGAGGRVRTLTTHPFEAEASGGLQKQWLKDLTEGVATSRVAVERHLPNKDDFWRSPPYEALREVVLRTPYHDALRLVMEHDHTFLFADVMCNEGAPMPHVIYEDFMKALTFSSRQRPPEEQFALDSGVLRDLLCWAAYYCTIDRHYFTSASLFFQKVEQEQHLSPAIHSAWVYICTAAGKLEEALAYAAYMDRHNIDFDADVFAYMLHPSLTPVQHRLRHAPQTSKGVVLQRRLCLDMQQHHGTAAVAVHAMFVHHILTLRHAEKWEVLRGAAEAQEQTNGQQQQSKGGAATLTGWTTSPTVTATGAPVEMISSRTMQLALSLFGRERGIRWGARTTRTMITYMLTNPAAGATAADILFVLMRVRRNESLPMLAGLPCTAFSEAEQDALMQAVHRSSRSDPAYKVAAPLLRELFAAGAPPEKEAPHPLQVHRGSTDGVLRAMQRLQQLSITLEDDHCEGGRGGSVHAPLASLMGPDAERGVSLAPAQKPAEVARDLLEAVMALDRESTAAHNTPAAPTPSGTTVDGTTRSGATGAADLNREMRLASLHNSLAAMGTSASLSRWALQQAEKEEEEARLGGQAGTAWIAPMYRP